MVVRTLNIASGFARVGVSAETSKMKKFMKAKIKNRIAIESLLPKFETHEKCCYENAFRVSKLFNSTRYSARVLAEKILDCDEEEPCFSLACYECLRRFRLKKISQLALFCEDYKEWKFATFIYYDEMVSELSHIDIPRLKNRLYKQLHHADITDAVIGYFEVEYSIECNHWLPHFHLLVKCRNSHTPEWERLRKLFQKQDVPNNINVIKFCPVEVKELKNPLRQIAYICKFMWQRKEVFIGKDERRKSKKYRLPKSKFIDALLKLDSLKLVDVEFMYRVKQNGATLKESVHGKK